MLVYLQNLPETKALAANFQFPPSDSGEALFQVEGLRGLPHRETGAGRPAAQPDPHRYRRGHVEPPARNEAAAAHVLAGRDAADHRLHLGASSISAADGSADRGKKVFAEKNCATCHNDPSSGAPKLGKGKDGYSDITMVAALWEHGPRMLDMMNQKKLAWPRFTARQMSDLIAYLNSL